MAIYRTDFSEYTTGQKPSDWTAMSGDSDNNPEQWWEVRADATATGGKVLAHISNQANFRSLIWSLVPTSEHQRFQMRWKNLDSPDSDVRFFSRCTANGVSTVDGYALGVRGADLDINKYAAGAFSNFASDPGGYTAQQGVYYFTEAEVVGTAPAVMRVRTWPESGTKPTTWEQLGTGPTGAVNDTDAAALPAGLAGLTAFGPDNAYIDWYVVTTAGEAPDFENTTPTTRKSSTFDIETTLGTITTATLNSVNVFDHVSQAGTTVSFAGATTDEIATSGEYSLVLGDGTGTETITVQVNVVGLPAYTLNKSGSALGNLTGVKAVVTATGELDGTELYSANNLTATAGVLDSNIELATGNVGDSVTVSILTAANDGVTVETTLELL